MADFEVTFTFAIAMPPPKKESKKKKQKPQKKSQKDFQGTENPEEQTTFKIDSKPFEYIHVNYTIVPKLLEYELDVAVWGSVAKVYTSGVCKAMKTILSNEGKVVWISFSICHHITLTTSELESLHANNVVFKIECGAKKVGQRAKGDKPKLFQLIQGEEDQENGLFLQLEEVFTSVMPSRATTVSDQEDNIEKSILCGFPTAAHVKCVEKYMDLYCGEKLETLLLKKDTKIEKDDKPLEKKDGGKGSKKSKKEKIKKNTQVEFRGELFFSDLKEISSQVECLTSTIPYASVTSSVTNLLTEEQEILMNPLVVRIEKLVCFPVTNLIAYKYKNVFFKIHLYRDKEVITDKHPVAEEMMIYDTRAVLSVPNEEVLYLQQIQTGLFRIEIYGTRDETLQGPPNAFGEDCNSLYTWSVKSSCASFGNRVTYAREWGKTTLLAVAHIDPYLILQDHLYLENWLKVEALPHGNHLLCEGDLRGCCLKIVLKQTRSLKESFMECVARGHHYNRICIISDDQVQAALILKYVLEINEELVPKRRKQSGNLLLADPQNQPYVRKSTIDKLYDDIFLKELGEDPIEIRKKNPAESVMSGFLLCDNNRAIIFLEGLANGKIQNLILELKEIAQMGVTIHYHSQLMFGERKYTEYLRQGGFAVVIIDEPLQNKVLRPGLLLDGYLDDDTRRSLLKLNRLSTVNDIVQASKDDLFPTPKSIANLERLFGMPMLLDGELDLFVPKRLHFQIVDAPRISEYCGMNSEAAERALNQLQGLYDEEEERELAASSWNSIPQSRGSGTF